jgi:hypothetical protein
LNILEDIMAMSRFFTSTTASTLQPLELEPSGTNSVIKSQAALHAVAKEIPHFDIARDKYPFNEDWHSTEFLEATDAQELLSVAGNFTHGKDFEADVFVSCNADEEGPSWEAHKVRDGHEFKEHVDRIRGRLPEINRVKTAVL